MHHITEAMMTRHGRDQTILQGEHNKTTEVKRQVGQTEV